MSKKTSYPFLLLSFLFISNFATAQYEDLMQNKDITWIAEFQTDLSFNLDFKENGSNPIDLRHFTAPPGQPTAPNGLWLTKWLFDDLIDGNGTIFTDSDLKTPIPQSKVQGKCATLDTVIIFDPTTSKETTHIIRNEIDPSDIRLFRTRQIMYLDARDSSIHTRLLALAHLVLPNGQLEKTFCEFAWMSMEDLLPGKLGYDAPFSWSATIKSPLEIVGLKTVKGKLNVSRFLSEEATDGTRKVVSSESVYSDDYLTREQIQNLYGILDTVIILDPKTFKENVQIVSTELKPDDFKQLNLVQDWFYDPKGHLLVNRLQAIAPMVNVFDDNGKYRYSKPMYYILFGK